jgi:folylpolyglutamate synthase/dihydropteroate synthase
VAAQIRAWGPDKPLHILTVMKKNKETDRFYVALAPYVRSALVLDRDIGLPMLPAQALCDSLKQAGIENTGIVQDLESAVSTLASQHSTPQRILVTGSLYLAGFVLKNHH